MSDTKRPGVAISMRVSLRDRPDGFAGLTGEDVTIGTTLPIDLYTAMQAVLGAVEYYYGLCYTADELNEQLDALSRYFATVRFSPTAVQKTARSPLFQEATDGA